MAGSSEERSEESIETEPSGLDETARYGPYKVGDHPRIEEYRQWWRNNPLNNIWTPKPSLWRRFLREVEEGKTPEEAARSGANITMEDLRMVPPAEPGAQDVPVDWAHMDSDDVWAGQPDPQVYEPSTNALTKEQLEEEKRKGNVITLRDFRKMLAEAEPWEVEAAKELVEVNELQHTPAVTYPDGSTISVWDLYQYTHHNPELKALAEKNIRFDSIGGGPTKQQQVDATPTWELTPDATRMELRPHEAAALEWGIAAQGAHWSRRPTRWLKGLDGRKDFSYGIYVHEEAATKLLGPRWARRNPVQVLADPQYTSDVVRSGPALGMTVLCVSSRPLPIAQLQGEWIQRLSTILRHQAAPSIPPPMPPPSSQPPPASTSVSPLAALSTPLLGGLLPWLRPGAAGAAAAGAAAAAATTSGAKGAAAATAPAAASSSGRGLGRPPLFARIMSPLALLARSSTSDSSSESSTSATTTTSDEEPTPLSARPLPAPAASPSAAQSMQPPPPPKPARHAQPPAAQAPAAARQTAAPAAASMPQPPAAGRPSAAVAPPAAAAPKAAAAEAAPVRAAAPPLKALPQLEGPWAEELTMLRAMFDPQHLAAGTKLVDSTGTLLRQGSKLLLTAVPDGQMLVQAVSPGTLRDQESYVLGAVREPALTHALLALFADPEVALDAAFARRVAEGVLYFANGFRAPTQGRRVMVASPPQPTTCSRWRLPHVGAPAPAPLVNNLQRYAMFQVLDDAFDAAAAAVAAVVPEPGEDERLVTLRKRMAAEAALKAALGGLGLGEEALLVPPPELEMHDKRGAAAAGASGR